MMAHKWCKNMEPGCSDVCHLHLSKARRLIFSGQHKESRNILISIVETCFEHQLPSDIVFEAVKLLNTLMCYKDADSFLLAMVKKELGKMPRLHSDITYASISLRLFLGRFSEAVEIYVRHKNQLMPPNLSLNPLITRRAKELLMILAFHTWNRGGMSLLEDQNPERETTIPGSTYEDNCVEAIRLCLVAFFRHSTDSWAFTKKGKLKCAQHMYQEALSIWDELQWSLEHSRDIIKVLIWFAVYKIQYAFRNPDSDAPILDKILHLNENIWRHCGNTGHYAGTAMLEMAQGAAERDLREKAAAYREAAETILKDAQMEIPVEHQHKWPSEYFCEFR